MTDQVPAEPGKAVQSFDKEAPMASPQNDWSWIWTGWAMTAMAMYCVTAEFFELQQRELKR